MKRKLEADEGNVDTKPRPSKVLKVETTHVESNLLEKALSHELDGDTNDAIKAYEALPESISSLLSCALLRREIATTVDDLVAVEDLFVKVVKMGERASTLEELRDGELAMTSLIFLLLQVRY